MKIKDLLKSWKFSLLDGEFVSQSSILRLEAIIKEHYHLVPFGNMNIKPDVFSPEIMTEMLTSLDVKIENDESIESIKEYHNL